MEFVLRAVGLFVAGAAVVGAAPAGSEIRRNFHGFVVIHVVYKHL